MSAVTVIYALLFYAATAILVIGVARKIVIYARTPQPLKIPTTPAPTTRLGVAMRMAREVTVFESLFKSNKWTWLFGWVFHLCLFVELLWHLRYFTEPVWFFVPLLHWFTTFTGFGMVAGLLGPVGAALPGGPGALHQRPVRSPDARAAGRASAAAASPCAIWRTPTSSHSRRSSSA